MAEEAVGLLADQPQHPLVHGSEIDRDRTGRRTGIEQRPHRHGEEAPAVVDRLAGESVPHLAAHVDDLPHLGRGVLERG